MNGERKKLPDSLRELLEDPNVLKVGCNIMNDRTKLIQDYELDLPKESFINIATFAVQRKVLTKSMSLKDLSKNLLGLQLNKPHHIRLSEDWTNVPLTVDQIRYAALDAYAGIMIYFAILEGQDPMFNDYSPAAILPGVKVNVYDSTGSNVIAIGVIDDQITGYYRDYRQTVTSGRAIVVITDIVVPCALIPIGLSKAGFDSKPDRVMLCDHLTNQRNDLLVIKRNIRPYRRLLKNSSSSSSSSL